MSVTSPCRLTRNKINLKNRVDCRVGCHFEVVSHKNLTPIVWYNKLEHLGCLNYTLLQKKRGRLFRAGPAHYSFENRWCNIDILYIILKGILWRFRFNLKFSKIFWFRDFMSKFREMTPHGSRMGVRKNFKLLKYEHILTYFKASDLEIPLI